MSGQPNVAAMGRFEWEKVIRRIVVPSNRKSVKVVAMMLATYADADGTNVRPGEQRLASVCQLGRSTVRESLGWMRTNFLIWRNQRGSNLGSANYVDVYQLSLPDDWQKRFVLLPEREVDEAGLIERPKRRNNNDPLDYYD